MKSYFITGATGVVGSAIVPLLLSDPNTSVVLLLRASTPTSLEAKLNQLKRFWGVSNAEEQISRRLRAVQGDVTRPLLGIEASEYQRLTRECTHLIHSAGDVRMTLPLQEARKCAVDSARHIMKFAKACQWHGELAKVEFVSTIGVAGRMSGIVPESWITQTRNFHNTYESAKAEAEAIVGQHAARGLPVTVHRPSMVVGHSETGAIIRFQIFYYLCDFLSGRRTRGFYPAFGDAKLDIVPVDYVARAIVCSSNHPAGSGRVLHLCSGPELAISISELRDKVRDFLSRQGESLPAVFAVPPAVFKTITRLASLAAYGKSRKALKSLPVFLDYLGERQTFINSNTLAFLAPSGIAPPSPATFIERILGFYYLRRGPQQPGRNIER